MSTNNSSHFVFFCLPPLCECLTASSCQALWPLSSAPAGGSCLWRPYCLHWGGKFLLDTIRRGRQATTVQRRCSPLHRSPLSQLTACKLGMKAAFLFVQPPGHSPSQGEGEKGAPALTRGLFGRRSLVVTEARGLRPGLGEPSLTCDTTLTHQ